MKTVTLQCEICGKTFQADSRKRKQCDECSNWVKTVPDSEVRGGYAIVDQAVREAIIKARFEAKEKNCTIIGKGYAERQIADSLRLAGKINTELEERKK